MKRDLELARSILLAVEASPEAAPHWDKLELGQDVGREEFWGHVRLLQDAGYLMPIREVQMHMVKLRGGLEISSAGHDFLDATRDPAIWRKAKAGAKKVGGVSLKMLGDIATALVRAEAVKLGILPP